MYRQIPGNGVRTFWNPRHRWLLSTSKIDLWDDVHDILSDVKGDIEVIEDTDNGQGEIEDIGDKDDENIADFSEEGLHFLTQTRMPI